MSVLNNPANMLAKYDFAGKYYVYPDLTGKRVIEGGKRVTDTMPLESNHQPKVSILTVCYNSERTIEQTFKSVFSQTYKNIEYIVVDGASTDKTVEIIKKYQNNIDYFVSEPDQGLYYAMNKAIELAKGELILILNSDDWLQTDAIETLVNARDFSGCDFVASLALYIDEESGDKSVLRSMPFDDSTYFRMPLRHETMLVPAWLYNLTGPYDTQYRIIADRDLTAKIFKLGATYYEVNKPLLNFRTSGVSNTNISLLNHEKDVLLSKEFPFLEKSELNLLNTPRDLTPEGILELTVKYPSEIKFIKACRALLADRYFNDGKKWRTDTFLKVGCDSPSKWPLVSVILPFYSAQDSIALTIESVLNQSFTNFEIICVNDCAVDKSQDVVDRFLQLDSRVKTYKNNRNLGLGASRNAGIRHANGMFIFHVDPDDEIPVNALSALVESALKNKSDLVKGAYIASQGLHENKADSSVTKYPCGVKDKSIVNTNLSEMPKLLYTTEGHWSFLYLSSLAVSTPYPTDLKMGQDSIFLVNAISKAKRITLIPDVVYHYKANPQSAMNKFTERKFNDALEWRRRAFHVLSANNHKELAERLLFIYWSRAFFENAKKILNNVQYKSFVNRLGCVFSVSGFPGQINFNDDWLKNFFYSVVNQIALDKSNQLPEGRYRIATFSTQDHGGAGIGSQRRVKALRKVGHKAEIFTLFKKTNEKHVFPVSVNPGISQDALRDKWSNASVLKRKDHPKLKARELFSKTESLVNFQNIKKVFNAADIVHLHWVVGMFDFKNADVLSDKPVVWTLADMNAFTGGCHYSEGCSEYINECKSCPLLEKGSMLAHEAWKTKKEAYDKIQNLTIICPSKWLADCARESSLFGSRPVHHLPNALPVENFKPTNKMVARLKLGLPINKKLIVFGAESLNNQRKGGAILQKSIAEIKRKYSKSDFEGIFFGANGLELGIKTHNLGHINDEKKLSLVYSAADVFAFPSLEDNAPLTVAESMLSGTPVVAFPVGNVPELVQHKENGYIAKYGNHSDFANGLLWILNQLNQDDAIRYGLKARVRAQKYNDPETSVDRHRRLYKSVIDGESDSLVLD